MSAFSRLYRNILAEIAWLGITLTDGDKNSLRTWLKPAWLASGCTDGVLVLKHPANLQKISVSITLNERKEGVLGCWWGDGTSETQNIAGYGSAVSHTYQNSVDRPVVFLGKITCLEGGPDVLNTGFRLRASLSKYLREFYSYYGISEACPLGDLKWLPAFLRRIYIGPYNTITGELRFLPRGLIYFGCGGDNQITGSIRDIPPRILSFECSGFNTIYGDVASVPSTIAGLAVNGMNTISGDITFLPSSCTTIELRGLNTVTGNLASLHQGVTHLVIYGRNTCFGEVSQMPDSVELLAIGGSLSLGGVTCNLSALRQSSQLNAMWLENVNVSYPTSRVWAVCPSVLFLRSSRRLLSSEVDRLLMDFSVAGAFHTNSVIDIRGDADSRTSASDAAVALLVSKGVTVNTN